MSEQTNTTEKKELEQHNIDSLRLTFELNKSVEKLLNNKDFVLLYNFIQEAIPVRTFKMYQDKKITKEDLNVNITFVEEFQGNIRGILKSARDLWSGVPDDIKTKEFDGLEPKDIKNER
jgi:hypothetical protein